MQKNKKAFTLIELLLYISIAGVMILSISIFLFTVLQSRVKNQTIAEIEQQGTQVMQIITQTIRNSSSIISPSQGNNSTSLEVDNNGTPTNFDLSGGIIRVNEGMVVNLTNSRITVSGLDFYNLSQDNTIGTIRIQFTLTHINPAGRNEYNYSKTFYGSASLKSPLVVIDTSGANAGGGGDKELKGLTLENKGSMDITIDKITVTWTDTDNEIKTIKIDGTEVWDRNGPGTPSGKQPSGTELDIQDLTLTQGSGILDIDKFKFDKDIMGDTFTIKLELIGGQTISISEINP